MASILSLLKKRHDDKQMSHADYVSKAVTAEASGDTRSIDVTKLELAMAAVGMDFSTFEKAVERERRVRELRSVIANLPAAVERHRDLAEHAQARKSEGEREIDAIRQEIAGAEQAASQAAAELNRVRVAEAELRALMESPARREARLAAKGPLSKLRRQQRDLQREAVDLESSIKNIDVRHFDFPEQRDRFLADRQAKFDRTEGRLAKVTEQLASLEAEAGESQPETAQAAG